MARIPKIQIEKLPEGVYLATSKNVPGLVAEGRTVQETLASARDVAEKLLEARTERLARMAEVADRMHGSQTR